MDGHVRSTSVRGHAACEDGSATPEKLLALVDRAAGIAAAKGKRALTAAASAA